MTGLDIKKPGTAMWDAASLGEIMLRLDPGAGRIHTAREFKVWEGGGEYNVVRGLRRCFGMRTRPFLFRVISPSLTETL